MTLTSSELTSLQSVANVLSVYLHLGGGTHGHLGLILTTAQYAEISNTGFTRPAHPGLLVILPVATAVQTSTIRDAYVEALRVFREVMGVEQAIIQQIITMIDATHPADVRDRTTNSINISVLALLVNLQDTYGTLIPHEL